MRKIEKNKPELVCPVGNWAALTTAIENGADSVYFGIKGLSMRNYATNFDALELKKIMSYVHKHNSRGYLALNVIIKEGELKKVENILKKAKSAGVDAVILWDLSVLAIAKKHKLKVHLSTQASAANTQALSVYARLGVKRAVLARECTLDEIRKIIFALKRKRIRCDIETFVHGAMCVSISGRCFLSYDSYGKSANRGECYQPCRREYSIESRDGELKYMIGHNYVLSPKDLCSIRFIDELIESGIRAFKIEGRMRAPEYVKTVVSCYRQAIDAYCNKELTAQLKDELFGRLQEVYNRGFSTGFYFGAPQDAVSDKLEHLYEKKYIGDVQRYFKRLSVAEIRLRTADLHHGQRVLIIGKNTPAQFMDIAQMQVDHTAVKKAEKGTAVGIRVPFSVRPKDKVFLWQKKGTNSGE